MLGRERIYGDVGSFDGFQGLLHGGEIGNVTWDDLAARLSQILNPRRVMRQTADFVSVREQRLGDAPANKAGCSDDKDFFHWVMAFDALKPPPQ